MDIAKVDPISTATDSLLSAGGDSSPRPTPSKAASAEAPPAPAERQSSAAAQVSSIATSQMEKLVSEVNKKLQAENHQARFEYAKEAHQVVFRLVDAESGEVLRQVPPESMLRMAEQLAKGAETHLIDTII